MTKDSRDLPGTLPAFPEAAWFDPIEEMIRDRVRGFIEPVLCGPLIEVRGDDRIERLHEPSAGRQGSDHFARPRTAQIGQHELGAVLNERVCCVDEYSAVPRWQARSASLTFGQGTASRT